MKRYITVIYMYTTRLRQSIGRVKVGSTRRLVYTALEAAEERIKEQKSAATSDDPPIILAVIDVSDMCETGDDHTSLSNLRTLEKSFLHKRMKAKGMWFAGDQEVNVDDSSEWFFATTTAGVVEEVESLVNQRRTGIHRPDSYSMREEQQQCHDVAVKHFMSGGDRFLINAKMRFGKTFVSYQIAKSLNVESILVLTYKPQVQDGWAEDLERHVDFDGWNYAYAKNFNNVSPVVLDTNSRVNVIFASFQDLNEMNKAKWKYIKNYKFDLVIIDEQHYGIETEKAKSTLSAINYDRILEVSGTPLHALLSGKFFENEIYSWTYADEQRKRQIEKDTNWASEIYRWLPVMQFMIFKVSDEARALCSHYDESEGFTMQKMFASEDGVDFIDNAAVKLWLENVYGVNIHKNQSPIRQNNSDHMIWKLPSVNSCHAMEALLKKTAWVKHVPVVVSGSAGTDLAGVKNAIQRFDKTVTLTCGSLMTGTTVPEWDTIFMLDGGSSAQDYFQTIFRVQSANKAAGKENCFVVDYNPQRNLQMIYEYAFVQSTVNGKSPQTNTQEFLNFAPVIDHTGNKPVRKNVNDLLDAIAHTANAIEKFGSGLNIRFDKMSDEVISILDPVRQDTKVTREIEVNSNDLTQGKNKTTSPKDSKKEPELTRKQIREIQQKAITVVQKLPNYLWLENKHIDTLQDIIYVNNSVTFKREVGISVDDLRELCDLEFLNTKRINLCIMAYQQLQKQLFDK
jgi:superfamily II DNA or RNA helicase